MNVPLWKIIFYIIITVCLIVLIYKPPSRKIDDTDIIITENTNRRFEIAPPKMIKTVGSKLVCESAHEILGQKIECDYKVSNSIVDCFDTIGRVAIDYKPKSFYVYDGIERENDDVYELYNRLYLEEKKKNNLQENKILYVEIPYTVDMCEAEGNTLRCYDKVSLPVRKERIKEHLKAILSY